MVNMRLPLPIIVPHYGHRTELHEFGPSRRVNFLAHIELIPSTQEPIGAFTLNLYASMRLGSTLQQDPDPDTSVEIKSKFR